MADLKLRLLAIPYSLLPIRFQTVNESRCVVENGRGHS
jgi:hypothetical protein